MSWAAAQRDFAYKGGITPVNAHSPNLGASTTCYSLQTRARNPGGNISTATRVQRYVFHQLVKWLHYTELISGRLNFLVLCTAISGPPHTVHIAVEVPTTGGEIL